jgi:hypothetical protein
MVTGMDVLRRASEFHLGSNGESRLSTLLEMEELRVRAACRELRLNSKACALGFFYIQQADVTSVTYASLWTVDAREARRDHPEMELFMWHPGGWDHWDFFEEPWENWATNQSGSLQTLWPQVARIPKVRFCLTSRGGLPERTGVK